MGLVGFASTMQQKRGGALSAAVEMASGREAGTMKWFNATKGSGFVAPDNGSGYLYFHQPSLKFGGRDGYPSLYISDSVEFEIRADWDGRPRAFNVTASSGDVLTGGSHGSVFGGGTLCYHRDDNLSYSGGSNYGVDGSRGFYSCGEEVADLPMVSAGTALQVLDDMPERDVIWDEEFGHCLDWSGGLLDLLAQRAEYFVDEETEQAVEMDTEDKLPQATGVHLVHMDVGSVVFDKMPLEVEVAEKSEQTMFMASIIDEVEVVDEISSSVLWDNELQHNYDAHDGLLKHLARDKECLHNYKNLVTNMASSLSDRAAPEPFNEIPPEMVVRDEDGSLGLYPHGSSLTSQIGMDSVNEIMWDEELSMIELNTNEDCIEQFYNKSSKKLKQDVSTMFLSPFVKQVELFSDLMDSMDMIKCKFLWSDLCGDSAEVDCNLPSVCKREQMWKVEFKLSNEHFVSEISAACYQFSRCGFSPWSISTRLALEEMPAWNRGNFSPGLCDHQSELCMDTMRIWDPGIWSYITLRFVHELDDISISLQFVQKFSEVCSLLIIYPADVQAIWLRWRVFLVAIALKMMTLKLLTRDGKCTSLRSVRQQACMRYDETDVQTRTGGSQENKSIIRGLCICHLVVGSWHCWSC